MDTNDFGNTVMRRSAGGEWCLFSEVAPLLELIADIMARVQPCDLADDIYQRIEAVTMVDDVKE
jgi:hypothetical protein